MFFQLLNKLNFVGLIIFSPVVVISNSDIALDFTATPATPTVAESVARPVTAAGYKISSYTQNEDRRYTRLVKSKSLFLSCPVL